MQLKSLASATNTRYAGLMPAHFAPLLHRLAAQLVSAYTYGRFCGYARVLRARLPHFLRQIKLVSPAQRFPKSAPALHQLCANCAAPLPQPPPRWSLIVKLYSPIYLHTFFSRPIPPSAPSCTVNTRKSAIFKPLLAFLPPTGRLHLIYNLSTSPLQLPYLSSTTSSFHPRSRSPAPSFPPMCCPAPALSSGVVYRPPFQPPNFPIHAYLHNSPACHIIPPRSVPLYPNWRLPCSTTR
jgi:hypothetical protein